MLPRRRIGDAEEGVIAMCRARRMSEILRREASLSILEKVLIVKSDVYVTLGEWRYPVKGPLCRKECV